MTPGDEVDPTSTYPVRDNQEAVDNATVQHESPLKGIVVRIEVSDTGNGIPPREITQGKLFSEFPRVLSHFGNNFPPTHSYSRIQSNRTGATTRRERYRVGVGSGTANREIEWWAFGSALETWAWINILG